MIDFDRNAGVATVETPAKQASSHPYLRFVVGRGAGAVGVAFGLVIVTFAMIRLIPGNPARIVDGTHATAAELAQTRRALGLTQSLPAQLWHYLAGVVTGHLGNSFQTGQSVTGIIAQRLPATAELAGAALFITLVLCIPIGLIAGVLAHRSRRRIRGGVFTLVTGAVSSTPAFVAGTFLSFVLAVKVHVFPVAGNATVSAIVLPALSIAALPVAFLSRIVRAETMRVLDQDYIRTAVSKRLGWRALYLRHVLPNAVTSTVSIAALLFAQLLAGTVVIENLFGWPGLGTALISGVINNDYPVVQGIIMVLGLLIVVCNAITDLAVAALNPHTALSRK